MSATAEAVRERPILFSGPMVRAILDGRKTQTRRVVIGHVALEWLAPNMFTPAYVALRENGLSRFGYASDLLWVRETWAPVSPDEMRRPIRECNIEYRADTPNATRAGSWDEAPDDAEAIRWRPSIHMPRWASRLALRVTEVRVERVQEIGEDDAIDEGCDRDYLPVLNGEGEWSGITTTARDRFRALWDELNAKRGYGWDANPWVWVISFERVATQPGGAA